MDTLREAFDTVEMQQQTLDVYTDEPTVTSELQAQFSTRNVRVVSQQLSPGDGDGFIIIRDTAGQFRGALGLDQLEALLSPEIHLPWELSDSGVRHADVLDFLDNTIFSSYDRRQMLAVTREIEERAWRENSGALHVGFQNSTAFTAQVPVYNRLARESSLAVRIYITDEWETEVDESIDIVAETGDEIGQFWFVLFDGGETDLNACGLLAEEQTPNNYYGFWTFDPDRLDEIITYLETTYGGR